ncbi:hypothetical protein [Labrys sp. 22185]|uniref:hypothetical protein n=1 Tax=Labrys sp. 22185 TaxID=3453888 RepID=UPI003F85E759
MAIKKGALNQLFAGHDPQAVSAKDGLGDELKKALTNRFLSAELDDDFGDERQQTNAANPYRIARQSTIRASANCALAFLSGSTEADIELLRRMKESLWQFKSSQRLPDII